ncbi:PhzF family phenazine biosynthesis protein [Vibrio breoganii]|uniref:PhzF family phenazine biosynthesis protein n=1 Tax=Vibrio breoganii TaxID=553239 RepID=UPI000C862E84|nr:PhzF family phenazine biosynthesis protein [Vibrio breoganii]PMK50700.1 isomerase [Vibrio breoganii]
MEIKIYQVDAFADNVFEGNPAAVCPLDEWLSDELLQNIAQENNLSETAFFVAEDNGYSLRWFTPGGEVDLCGHATLASAHVLFQHLGYSDEVIAFHTISGALLVGKSGTGYSMSFPASDIKPTDAPSELHSALGVTPVETLSDFDYVVILDNESQVASLTPDFTKLSNLGLRGVVVSAPGENVDFVSRCFFPKFNVDEDPVTGSAHCELAPYWAKQLGRTQLVAKQLSKRTGVVHCEVVDDRVFLSGNAVDYMSGTITIKA